MSSKRKHYQIDRRVVRRREATALRRGVELSYSKTIGRVVRRGWGTNRVIQARDPD